MTEAQRKVLKILDGQSDPLTSADLAAISGLAQIHVVQALRELQSTHAILKSTAGYTLHGVLPKLPVLAEPDVKIQILQVLIATAGGHMQQQLQELLCFVQESTHATA